MFGIKGLLGITVSGILFCIIGIIILVSVYKNDLNGYQDFLVSMLGNKLSTVFEVIILFFLFGGYCVMLAGSGAIFFEQFHLPYNIGIFIMGIATLITFLFSIKGISVVNQIIVPLLLAGIITLSMLVISKEGLVFSNYKGAEISITGNWLTSSIIYVSYNCISVLVVMSTLSSIIPNKTEAIKGGLFGGLCLLVLAVFILIPLLILYTDVFNLEIPMLKAAKYLGKNGETIYSLILWCAMFTTAIANGFGCIRRVSKIIKIDERLFSILFVFLTIPMAKIGFSSLISILYPLYGMIGIPILVSIISSFILKKI
ncbi:YkvI family membrane protein [Caloranaerobacter sp. DY30410]|uniref:YkvI family membrane protein n=1 Tax=Caloranaerobacter sp. DY30410 TaxID=3238305 RepID=UPI003D001E16